MRVFKLSNAKILAPLAEFNAAKTDPDALTDILGQTAAAGMLSQNEFGIVPPTSIERL